MTPLSSSIRPVRWFLIPLLGLIYVGVLWNTWHSSAISTGDIVGLLVVPLAIFLLYKLIDSSFASAFDAEFLYLYRKTGTEQIPLANVHKIKKTMSQVNQQYFWKIGYRDAQNQERVARILPIRVGIFGSRLKEFEQAVVRKNPRLNIVRWSHSFDFD